MWSSIEEYCSSQQPTDFSNYPQSSQEFLHALNLPTVHPFCHEDVINTFEMDGIPPMGPLVNRFDIDGHGGILGVAYTIWRMIAPPLLAMGELWLRLFGAIFGPIGICCLLIDEVKGSSSSSNGNGTTKETTTTNDKYKSLKNTISIVCLLACASSLVLMTDTLYVHARGPTHGIIIFVLSVGLAIRACIRHDLQHVSLFVCFVVWLAIHLIWDYETNTLTFGNSIDQVKIQEGLYYDTRNEYVSSIINHWPEQYRTYSTETGKTRWMPSGDSLTGIPFLVNFVDDPQFTRVYLPTLEDDEVLALDILFPPTGHDPTKPMYMVLHGLNGGSKEEFVQDFCVRRAYEEGSTVVIMIARGLMDLPIRGWNLFHGARTVDAHATALALRQAVGPDQVLVGVGFSMGAIVLSNFVSSYGQDVALDAAVAISGGLDMRAQAGFTRAKRLWQPMLAEDLRDIFLVGKWGKRVKERLSHEDMLRMMRASDVSAIDESAVVPYNGFDNLTHYYSSMSALGDIPVTPSGHLPEQNAGKVHNISVPLCVIHALDDPLITWRTVAANEGFMHPENLSRSGSGNLVLLLTKEGGHVGWPLGFIPSNYKWKWMNDAAMSFAQAVFKAKLTAAPSSDAGVS